ncbi:hypothetical protein HYT52_00735 [Candidatus Woesearchaeota archaeon]|nr:hypothetical protein [Candidatus Woesearchaeota archaeon]
MAEDDYEILPHQLLQDLKFDVESLKKKLTQPDAKANELILEIESMKDSIHELNDVFKKALDETKGESISSTIKELKEKIDNVVDQNETIAKALISISDKLDNFMDGQRQAKSMPRPVPVQHTMGPPGMPMPGRMAPPPEMPRQMSMPPMQPMGGMSLSNGMPMPPPTVPVPPPPSPGLKRKGLFQ